MIKDKKTILYFAVGLTLVISAGFWSISKAQQDLGQQKQTVTVLKKGDLKGADKKRNPPPTQQELKEATAPIGDFNYQVEPGEKGKKRKFRNEKFRPRDYKGNLVDVSKSALNENSFPSGEQGVWSNFKKQPAFPITPDTLVVIGTVTNAEAFITEDKVKIYSEFTFEIQDLLKPGLNGYMPPKTIILSRSGGRIKLPSGKVLYRGFEGQYYPQKQKTYLMFIRNNGEEDYYWIVTGYELINNGVRPLDGRRSNGQYIRQYKEYERFEEVPVIEFANIVKNEILAKKGNQE
jgi:hypothetical protein